MKNYFENKATQSTFGWGVRLGKEIFRDVKNLEETMEELEFFFQRKGKVLTDELKVAIKDEIAYFFDLAL